MIPGDQQILEQVQKIIAEVLRIPQDQVTPDSQLGEDLGGESLDFVDLQFGLETNYGVEFYQGGTLDKLAEVLAPQKLEENELLSSLGAAILQARMPEVDPARLQQGQPAAGIESFYTPRTWVRVIKEILSARPRACPKCGSDQLKIVRPSVLLCQACRNEVNCPTGEECLEAWAKNMAGALQGSHKT